MDQWGECVRGGQALVEIVGEAGVGGDAGEGAESAGERGSEVGLSAGEEGPPDA